MSDDWEEIAVPRGAYIGWGEKPGQKVIGEVLSYGDADGTDFDGKSCPQVSVVLTAQAHSHSKQNGWSSFDAGELVVINCGQASLKRAVQAARLNPGDLMHLEMEGIEPLKGGKTVKVFKIKVKRGNGELSQKAREAMAKADADAAASEPAGDPWGSAPATAGAGFGGADDEPPF
jgi:hypothetical protein